MGGIIRLSCMFYCSLDGSPCGTVCFRPYIVWYLVHFGRLTWFGSCKSNHVHIVVLCHIFGRLVCCSIWVRCRSFGSVRLFAVDSGFLVLLCSAVFCNQSTCVHGIRGEGIVRRTYVCFLDFTEVDC